jgi:hypothetical protein
MQIDLGTFGSYGWNKEYYMHSSFPFQILINTLAKFRNNTIRIEDVNSVDDCFMRYLGDLEERTKKIRGQLFNPFVWCREGIIELIIIPIRLLYLLNIINNAKVEKIKYGKIYSVLSSVLVLTTFTANLVTIFGWFNITLKSILGLL